MSVNIEHTTAFRSDLVAWYRASARDLPWRDTSDPYLIWVSEVMLQQTRVDQAIGYFNRFVSAFPDVHALSSAKLNDVLLLWEGLGYYARARYLHSAARKIVRELDGAIPATRESLLQIPGVGDYTAAAVASIAFGEPVAAVDGNVTRVLARVFGIEEPVRSTAVKKRIRVLAQELIDLEQPGCFNQAMMELGATVCTPSRPSCRTCPLQNVCQALRFDLVDVIPAVEPRKSTPHYDVAVSIVRDRDERVLLVQREDERLLGKLWEYPTTRIDDGEPAREASRRDIRERLTIDVVPGSLLTEFKHRYSHFRITVHAFEFAIDGERPAPVDGARYLWSEIHELDAIPMHRSARKISDLLMNRNVH